MGFTEPHSLAAQDEWPDYVPTNEVGEHGIDRGPGFYLAWWKLAMCLPIFLFWVKATDWVNVDLQRNREKTKLDLDTWNPVMVFAFFAGFLILLSLPIFWIGYPLFVVAGVLPYGIYLLQRNKLVDKNEKTWLPFHGSAEKKRDTAPIVLKQDEGIAVEFKASGNDPQRAQANLIAARQNPFFIQIKEFVADILSKRAERVQMEFSQQAVGVRYEVDGVWLNMPQRDRQSGDAILYGLKQLANLNPMDRQNRQDGTFEAAAGATKSKFEMSSAGVQTGERVIFKVTELKKKSQMNILQLGMLPEMLAELQPLLNQSGYFLISGIPGEGISSAWTATLDAADRVTRDFVGVCDVNFQDKVIENVEFKEINKSAGETPLSELKNLALKLPQAFVVPDPFDGETIDYLCGQIEAEEMFVVSLMPAKSSIEAVLRMLMLKPDRSRFAKHLNGALFHRLFRRLCPKCKQPVTPPPQLLQQLGIQPDPKLVFYQQYQPPPPESLIDEKGRPIDPPPPCGTCGGIGYFGRIAVFELLKVDDNIRAAMVNTPTVKDIGIAAQASGHQTVQKEAIKLLSAGITSLQELQRVLQQK